VLDIGDSNRLSVRGLAVFRPAARVDLSYGLSVYRDVLDEQESSGVGHGVSLRVDPWDRLQLLGLYQYRTAEAVGLPGAQTQRAEGVAQLHLPLFDLITRLSTVRTTVNETQVTETIGWLEVGRAFDWRLR
jgi:hypothetical protein